MKKMEPRKWWIELDETGNAIRVTNTPDRPEGFVEVVEKLKYDEAVSRNICDACLGEEKPDCMCGGTGRMSDAAIYLRERLIKVSSEQGGKLL